MTGYTAVMPVVGSTFLMGTVYTAGPWLQSNWEIGVVLLVAVMTVLAGIALIATNILGIVSGFAFDFPLGLAAYLAGILGASSVMFVVARRFASHRLQPLLDAKPKLKAVHGALLGESVLRTFLVLILVRLSPAIPFAATNFVVASSGVSFPVFVLGTFVGMLPRSAAVVFVGSSLSELDFDRPHEMWLVVVGIAASILGVITLGVVSRRALLRLSAEAEH